MLPRQSDEVMVSDLIRASHQIRAHDPVCTTQIIRNKAVSRVRQESSQDAERLVGSHAIAKQRMRGNTREAVERPDT